MFLLRLLLFPFACIYGVVILVRNKLYDTKIYSAVSYDFPLLVVGNLSMGGSGKTPHVEYIIKLWSQKYKVATLSRGYKRNTYGYLLADASSTASTIGDEPMLYYKKFGDDIRVAVAENRVNGIAELLADAPEIQVVVLDDAFQHRALMAGFNIVITPYSDLFTNDYLIPMGRLREFRGGANRAQAIVVSKCPDDLDEVKMNLIEQQIGQYTKAPVFFSYYQYGNLYMLGDESQSPPSNAKEVILLTGIANTTSLEAYLTSKFAQVSSLQFPDHHHFTERDLFRLQFHYNDPSNQIIITTEKDAMRLLSFQSWLADNKINVYIQPIEVRFMNQGKFSFDDYVTAYLEANLSA